jgi:hypothetical protein
VNDGLPHDTTKNTINEGDDGPRQDTIEQRSRNLNFRQVTPAASTPLISSQLLDSIPSSPDALQEPFLPRKPLAIVTPADNDIPDPNDGHGSSSESELSSAPSSPETPPARNLHQAKWPRELPLSY